MKYICGKRYKDEGLAGHFNIPANTTLDTNSIGRICYQNKAVCADTSKTSHDYFAINEDGKGRERFDLTQGIKRLLNGAKNKEHKRRWNVVMEDDLCQKYSRKDNEDHWLWNDAFYKAPISDLEYIIQIVKEA